MCRKTKKDRKKEKIEQFLYQQVALKHYCSPTELFLPKSIEECELFIIHRDLHYVVNKSFDTNPYSIMNKTLLSSAADGL